MKRSRVSRVLLLLLLALFIFSSAAYAVVPAPTGQDVFQYSPVANPAKNAEPGKAKPFAVGSVAQGGKDMSLMAGFDKFSSPVDIYLGIYAPALSPEILLITDSGGLQPASAGLAKWRSGISASLNEPLFGDLPAKALPQTDYTFYVMVTPPNSFNSYYIWTTTLSLPVNGFKAKGMCPQGGGSMPVPVPDREGYLALVNSASQSYKSKLGDVAGALDSLLASAENDNDGANLGAVLTASTAGSAGVYATSISALRNPDDAIIANNLSMTLQGQGDYMTALQMLLYADSISPDMGLTAANLGWVYYNMGDTANAQAMFQKASQLAPNTGKAKLGLGLVAGCQGDYVLAAGYLKESITSDSFTEIGGDALGTAEGAAEDAGGQPRSEPLSKERSESKSIKLPSFPLFEDIEASSQSEGAEKAIQSQLFTLTQQFAQQSYALTPQLLEKFKNQYTVTSSGIEIDYLYHKETFMFNDVIKIIGRNISDVEATALEKWGQMLTDHGDRAIQITQKYSDDINACAGDRYCQEVAEYNYCMALKELYSETYAKGYALFKPEQDEILADLDDITAFTSPILAKIYDPVIHDFLEGNRNSLVLIIYGATIEMKARYLAALASDWAELDCVKPTPPPPPEPEEIETNKENVNSCDESQKTKIKLPVVTVSFDCSKVKLDVGAGLAFSYEANFKKHTETFFIGAGLSGSAGPLGGIGAGAKTGAVITMDSKGVSDFGWLTEVSGSVGHYEGKISSSITINGGPKFDASTATKITIPKF